MLRLYRWLAKGALWIVTGLMPVVIAACYGMYYEFTRYGRVIDRTTRASISGIKVTCRSGVEATETYSDGDGEFWIEAEESCDVVLFEDVDGAANGSYQTRSVPLAELPTEVELDPTATP